MEFATPSQVDPYWWGKDLWPNVDFYTKQLDVAYSVMRDDETYVPAGNKLGKDFVAAFIALWFFCTREPCRIITTSAKDDHLRVLWGEINWFLRNAAGSLDVRHGGNLIVNHHEIRKLQNDGTRCPISYLRGMVAAEDSIAAMGGHHADPKEPDGVPHTLFIGDEASSLMDAYYQIVAPWAKRMLIIGNTWPCDNFFKRAIKGNDLQAQNNGHYYRRVIHIRATDSPNIKLALGQIRAGAQPTHEIVTPGVKTYAEYLKDRATQDKAWLTVSHDAEFYEGQEAMLYPAEWLGRAGDVAAMEASRIERHGRAMGVDPAEGGDRTAMVVVDEKGIIELVSRRTPDTSAITGEALAFMRRHKILPENVVFDRGGGGKEHADRLRAQGYPVRTVAFGESVAEEVKRGTARSSYKTRLDIGESRYAYKNRRAQMYGELRLLLDPSINPRGFGIPRECEELRRQLSAFPLRHDDEGRLVMLPKDNKQNPDSDKMTLRKLLGCSPDESDALVLAVHGMLHKANQVKAGVA
jgi:hypothetical protein